MKGLLGCKVKLPSGAIPLIGSINERRGSMKLHIVVIAYSCPVRDLGMID